MCHIHCPLLPACRELMRGSRSGSCGSFVGRGGRDGGSAVCGGCDRDILRYCGTDSCYFYVALSYFLDTEYNQQRG